MADKYPWTEKWSKRAEKALKFVPRGSSIIDLGGGLGTVYELMNGQCKYVSIDTKQWNDKTVVADLNFDFPDIEPAQFVLCLGVLEYIEQPKIFLNQIKKYGDKLIISYRLQSVGGIDRRNSYSFAKLEKLLKSAGWEVIARLIKTEIEKIYFCSK